MLHDLPEVYGFPRPVHSFAYKGDVCLIIVVKVAKFQQVPHGE